MNLEPVLNYVPKYNGEKEKFRQGDDLWQGTAEPVYRCLMGSADSGTDHGEVAHYKYSCVQLFL